MARIPDRPINPTHLEHLMALINDSPYFSLLGIQLKELGVGYCKAEVSVEHKHLNAFGGIHGGAYASMVDCAAYWALYCNLPEDMGYITLDLVVDNLRAIDSGLVTIEGSVIKQGGSICLTEAEARDEQGRLLVHCQSKQFLSPTLQPVSAAVRAMGAEPLPPKFL